MMLKQCKIYPLFPKRRQTAKTRSFFHLFTNGMRSSYIYISEWVPQGKNNNSTSAMTSPLLEIFQKLALKAIIKVQYKNQPQKFKANSYFNNLSSCITSYLGSWASPDLAIWWQKQPANLPYKAQSSKDPVFVFCSLTRIGRRRRGVSVEMYNTIDWPTCFWAYEIRGFSRKDKSVLTAHNWQKWKRVFLTCSCHKICRDEAVGLKSCKYTWKITIFVKMWNLGQYLEKLKFGQRLLEVRI